MATFITSDWHFDHNNICGKDGFVPTRNHFESVEEMNEEIIKQINSVATKEDVLYHLGDIGLGKPKRLFELLERINPRIVLVAGNHDSFSKTMKYIAKNNYVVDKNGNMRYTIYEVGTRHKQNGKVYLLSHYPLGLGDQRINLRNFCGHIHENASYGANVLNVGVDSPELPKDLPFGQPLRIEVAIDLVEAKWSSIMSEMSESDKKRYS